MSDEQVQEEEELLLLDQATTATPTANHPSCINCGFHPVSPASLKRSSPDLSTASAPRHKKPNNLHGFSKIPLPTHDPQSPPHNADMTCPDSPLSAARAAAAKLPPRAPPLRRSVSDPNPSPSKFPSSSGLVGGYESPNDKRLKRMRDCIRELNKWWDEMLPEEEENGTANNIDNNATMGNSEADVEESVSVERAGECLIIHFKCPCRKGYQILISGRNCYYKLM